MMTSRQVGQVQGRCYLIISNLGKEKKTRSAFVWSFDGYSTPQVDDELSKAAGDGFRSRTLLLHLPISPAMRALRGRRWDHRTIDVVMGVPTVEQWLGGDARLKKIGCRSLADPPRCRTLADERTCAARSYYSAPPWRPPPVSSQARRGPRLPRSARLAGLQRLTRCCNFEFLYKLAW
jgi:hypothetical protein